MSMRLAALPCRVTLAGTAIVLSLAGGAAPVRAASPATGAEATVHETATTRSAASRPRATSRIRVSVAVGAGAKPSSLSVTLGGFTIDVPLRHGRHRGRMFTGTGTVDVNVTTRRGRLDATFRSRVRDGGSVIAESVVRDAAADALESGMAYDLEEATIAVDGVATQLALGVAARIDTVPGADGTPLTRARVAGAALAPSAPPVVQIPRMRPDDPWTGRVAGHALGAGSVPHLVASLSGGTPTVVAPIDAAARSIGSTVVESPGVRSLTIGTETFFQVRFDMAVQSAEGPQSLLVGVPVGRRYDAEQTVEFVVPEPVAPLALAADSHVLEIRGDRTLWAWGDNLFGQVGDGTTLDPLSPVPLAEPPAVRAVAAGGDVSLALDLAGAVWLWGEWNGTHDLPGGGSVTRNIGELVPTPYADLPGGITAIAAGEDHALALDQDGEVWSFGENYSGQLGDGTFDDHAKHPQHVKQLPPIVAVAAGGTASLALDADGVVWTWGAQNLAGIGDGTHPVAVAGLPPVAAISAGSGHSLALATDGTLWAWGLNPDGELGDGTQTDSDVPVQVSGLENVAAISAGAFHSLALLHDGTVWAWGDNESGALGDGTSDASSVPVQVRDLVGVNRVCAGASASYAVDSVGAVWVWGSYRFLRGPVGSPSGVYPRLAARGFVEGHYPETPVLLFPKSRR